MEVSTGYSGTPDSIELSSQCLCPALATRPGFEQSFSSELIQDEPLAAPAKTLGRPTSGTITLPPHNRHPDCDEIPSASTSKVSKILLQLVV